MVKEYIALRKHDGKVIFGGVELPLKLPEGSTGVLFIFNTKKAARKYFTRNVQLLTIEEVSVADEGE